MPVAAFSPRRHERRWRYSRFGYALSSGLELLGRRRLSSACTLIGLGLTLTLPFMLFFAQPALKALAERTFDGESLTVFLNPQINELDARLLAQQWQERGDVASTRFISSDDALQTMQSETGLEDIVSVLGTNPLPASIVVYPQQQAQQTIDMQSLATALTMHSAVDDVLIDLEWIQRLQSMLQLIQWLGVVVTVLLCVTALLVITNTIRLQLVDRQKELEVANLLGASRRFTGRSALFSGAVYGFLAGVLGCLFALLLLWLTAPHVNFMTESYQHSSLVVLPDTYRVLFALLLAIVLGITGAIGSLRLSSDDIT